MALLPKVPWTDIDDFRVAVDAPVSTDLWTDTVVDLNYLKAVLTDGALAPQLIAANSMTLAGSITISGAGTAFQLDNDGNVDGDFNVAGTLSTGVFFSSEQLLWLFAF